MHDFTTLCLTCIAAPPIPLFLSETHCNNRKKLFTDLEHHVVREGVLDTSHHVLRLRFRQLDWRHRRLEQWSKGRELGHSTQLF